MHTLCMCGIYTEISEQKAAFAAAAAAADYSHGLKLVGACCATAPLLVCHYVCSCMRVILCVSVFGHMTMRTTIL